MKQGERIGIIALVPDRWDDVVMPRHQVLKRLARHFHVVWVEPPRSWRACLTPGDPSFLAADRWRSPTQGFDVLTPGYRHPRFYRPRWLGRLTFRSRLAAARRRLLAMGATHVVLYLWRDEFAEALDLVRHDAALYHIDDEYSFSEIDVPNQPREIELIRRVDDVIVHSARLREKKSGINANVSVVHNGVDYEAFARPRIEPADLTAIPHPRIGYVGVIKKQLDLRLVDALAEARPDYSFVLVGPIMKISGKEREIESLRGRRNVHFLGRKPADELGAYVQHLDVCMMCYEINAYTNYIYPLKLHEYLAAGRPVVSSPIHSVVEHSDVVRLANGVDEWLAAIDAALQPEASALEAVQRRQSRARRFDWSDLVAQVAVIVRRRLDAKAAGPRSATAGAAVGMGSDRNPL